MCVSVNAAYSRIWQANRWTESEAGSQDCLQAEAEVKPTQSHKYMHARTRADTHTHTKTEGAFVCNEEGKKDK